MNKITDKQTIEELFSEGKKINYKKGEILLRPEDTPTDVYYIEEGYVRIYALTEWGDEKLTAIYKKAELFPLLYVFDKIPLTKYYEAMDSVTVRKIPVNQLLSMCAVNPKLLRQFMSKMSALVEIYSNRIDNLEYTNARARLVSRLLYLAKRFGEKKGNGIIIKAPVTHKDIAASTAMTRETTSREFEKLEKNGIVGYVNKLIIISDIGKLEKELTFQDDLRL